MNMNKNLFLKKIKLFFIIISSLLILFLLLLITFEIFDNSNYHKSKNETYAKIIKNDFSGNLTKLKVYNILGNKYKNFKFRPIPINSNNGGYDFVEGKPQTFKNIKNYFSESKKWYVFDKNSKILCELNFNSNKLFEIRTINFNDNLKIFDPCNIKFIGLTYDELNTNYITTTNEDFYFETNFVFKKWPKNFDNDEYYLIENYSRWELEGNYNGYFPIVILNFYFDKNKNLEKTSIYWPPLFEI